MSTDLLFDGTKIVPSEGYEPFITPATKDLYEHQSAALETIGSHPRVVLGMPAGTGKTAVMQTQAALGALAGLRTLCIVPPSLSISPWSKEFETDFGHLSIYMAQGGKLQPFPDVDVVIISDSILAKRIDDCIAWAPDQIMGDEAHRYKNPDSKRTKAVIKLCDTLTPAQVVIMATGTLSDNNVGDVFHPLRATGVDNAKAVSYGPTWTDFLDVHCTTEVAWKKRVVTGCQDVEWLRERLVATCMISVDRDEVLDLPARTFSHTALTLSGKAFDNYRYAQKHFLDWVEENFGDKAMIRASKAEAMTKLMRLWELDGLAKVPATCEYVRSLTDQDEPVVVMAWHSKVVTGIADNLSASGLKVRTIKGGVSPWEKAEIVGLFQAGLLDVVVGQIISAGTGLTLTAAAHIVFAQLPWSPGSFSQACDRIFRIGQERKVFVHILCGGDADGKPMVSERMYNVIKAKAEDCDMINYGKSTVTIDAGSVINEVLESFATSFGD